MATLLAVLGCWTPCVLAGPSLILSCAVSTRAVNVCGQPHTRWAADVVQQAVPEASTAHSLGMRKVFRIDAVLRGVVRNTDRYVFTAPGVVDQTRGILTYCSDACPGAFHDSVGGVSARAWGCLAGGMAEGLAAIGMQDYNAGRRVAGDGFRRLVTGLQHSRERSKDMFDKINRVPLQLSGSGIRHTPGWLGGHTSGTSTAVDPAAHGHQATPAPAHACPCGPPCRLAT